MTNHPNRSKQRPTHTPGPWRVEPMRARGKYAGCIQVAPANGPAHVFLGQGRDDIQAANARLIAAAPELLAALDNIVTNAKLIPDPAMEGTTDTYSVPLDDVETARSILAKAYGR